MDTETKTDWPQELERLAREAEPEALAGADEFFAEAAAEHERQTAGYHFECRRWGDFLSVFIERRANQKDWSGGEPQVRISTSLNIGGTKDIRLQLGHCFDRRGIVRYRASMESDDGSSSGWGTGHGRSAPSKGCHYTVRAGRPYIPKSRNMVSFDPKPDSDRHGSSMGMGNYQPRYVTEGYPRPAEDDTIRFEGIGVTIYAPAGMGQGVYDAILTEIARGYEPPAIAIEAAKRARP